MEQKKIGFVFLLFVFIVIFLIFVGGGYVFIKKSQKETETDISLLSSITKGWAIYDSKPYGVYIKYPADWTIKKFSNYGKAVYFEPPGSSPKNRHPKIRLEFISRNFKEDIDKFKQELTSMKTGKFKISEKKLKNNIIKITGSGNISGEKISISYYVFTMNIDGDYYYLLSLDGDNDSSYENVLDGMASTFNFVINDNTISKYLLAEKGAEAKDLATWARADAEDFKKSYGGDYYFQDNGFGICNNFKEGQYFSNKEIKINCVAAPKRFAVSFKFIDPKSNAEIEYCTDYSNNIFYGTIDNKSVKCAGVVIEKEM